MNVAIQINDELICLYTTNIDRAKEVCQKANISYEDMYEVKDEEMQYYCFNSRLWDLEVKESK